MHARMLAGLTFMAVAPFLTGCSTMSNTGKGALVGGGLGAGTGALIGKATGSATKGAVIGGAAGALLGGVIGNDMDQQEKKAQEARIRQAEDRQAYASSRQMTIDDVIAMKQAQQSDDIVINQIRTTNSSFQLSTNDISRLSAGGVSDKVIMEMQNHRPSPVVAQPAQFSRPVIVAPPPPQPVYILQPAPPPPPGFHVGVRVP